MEVVGDEGEGEAAVLSSLRLIHQVIRLSFLAGEGVAELDVCAYVASLPIH
jgi:hypothetical protein